MKKNELVNRIVYVVEDINVPQFRYRVKNIIDVFNNNDAWEVEYFCKSDLTKLELKNVRVLIILRQTAKDRIILKLIKKAKGLGVKVLFDLDDLVFDYRDLRLIAESVHEKNELYWLGYIWGVRRIAKKVDGFICTNKFLADKLKRSFNKPVKVIRNSLNTEQIELSKKLIKEKCSKAGKSFVIGYFSGSSTHVNDFKMIELELVKFLNMHEDVKLEIVGYMKLSSRIKSLIGKGKVEVIKPVGYLELLRLVSNVDVNIVPLVINGFTNCKSELKYFEAGIVETTTIASPIYSFKKAIHDEENGFLAKSGGWFGKLEYLYKNPEINHKTAIEARKDALKNYYGNEFLKEVEEAYEYFTR